MSTKDGWVLGFYLGKPLGDRTAQGWNNDSIIALWPATNRWYVVKCVSQKRNQSNNKSQWYNILVTSIFKSDCGQFETKIGLLSNLSNCKFTTRQYYKLQIGNGPVRGWSECDYSILGRSDSVNFGTVRVGGLHGRPGLRCNTILRGVCVPGVGTSEDFTSH